MYDTHNLEEKSDVGWFRGAKSIWNIILSYENTVCGLFSLYVWPSFFYLVGDVDVEPNHCSRAFC